MLSVTNVFVPKFDEEKHRYTTESGLRLPSVTQILHPISLSLYEGVDPETLQLKAELGSAVHSCIEYLIEDDLDESSIDLSWKPYIDAWKYWRSVYQPNFLHTELRLGCELFCGTVDCICEIAGDFYVIDWKTTDKLMKTVGPQTAAYELLARDYAKSQSMLHRAALQLKPNGQFVFERYSDVNDYAIFEHLLIVNQWMHK